MKHKVVSVVFAYAHLCMFACSGSSQYGALESLLMHICVAYLLTWFQLSTTKARVAKFGGCGENWLRLTLVGSQKNESLILEMK